MQQLAPDVWAHSIDAEGFPTLSAVILTARLAIVVDTLTGPRDMDPVVEFLAAEAGGAGAWWSEHAPPLGPRVRQRRLHGRGHRRPARLPAPHPGGAAGRRRVAPPAAARRRPPAQHHLRRPPDLRGRGRVGAPDPHAGAQRGLAGRLPRGAPAAVRRRHRGVAAAQLLPARRPGGVGAHAAPAQAAAGRPGRARARAGDGQADHRRQRALRGRRLRGGRRGQGPRRRPRRARPAARRLPRRTASSSTTCTRPSTARTFSGPGTRSSRAAAPAAGGRGQSARTSNWTLSSNWCTKGS